MCNYPQIHVPSTLVTQKDLGSRTQSSVGRGGWVDLEGIGKMGEYDKNVLYDILNINCEK